jgi:DNA polymerase-3 subunit alpha
VPEWDEQEKLAREKDALGIYLSGHPLEKFQQALHILADHTIVDLEEYTNNGPVTVGGLAISVKETITKKGDRMAFLTLEDQLGSIEVVVFNEVFQRAGGLLAPGQPLLVRGAVSQEEKGPKLIAQEIRSLAAESAKIPPALHLHLHLEGLDREILLRLREVLARHAGPVPAFLHFVAPPNQEEVLALPRELHLRPSASLREEVNRLFPYPVLDS